MSSFPPLRACGVVVARSKLLCILLVYQANMCIFVDSKKNQNFKYYIMTQINRQQQGGVVYFAPSMSVLDVETEGLLCLSGQGSSIEPGTEENWGEL